MTRRLPSGEDLRASLWFWPTLAAIVAVVIGFVLPTVPTDHWEWAKDIWTGGAQAAGAVMQVVATSTIAATALMFSLTVIALQLSSQQFSPRLLRAFARDRITQGVLALLVSTFVIALTGLRAVADDRPVPLLSVTVVTALGVASVVSLLAFTGHFVRSLRVETMMVAVHRETAATLDEMYRSRADDAQKPATLPPAGSGTTVLADRSGFVQVVKVAPLLAEAERSAVVIAVEVRPGDHVAQGTPVARVWAEDGFSIAVEQGVEHAVLEGVELGYERTVEQDAALGFRRLTDIAVKAISPAINDPTTAAHAIGFCSDLFILLLHRPLGLVSFKDSQGTVRVLLPDRDLRYYLDAVCGPIRRYGSRDATVVSALLRMLRDMAANTRDPEARGEIQRQLRLVAAEVTDERLGTEVEQVEDLLRRVQQSLAGDLEEAFADRSGETRSV